MSSYPPAASSQYPMLQPQGRPSSPTPSELEDADERPFGFRNLMSRGQSKPSKWTTIGLVLLVIFFIVVLALHSQIVDAIEPVAEDLRNLPGGWAIPIGILAILSFPPLFGHELVDIMVGVVWGVWKGFLIAAAGHLLGEIANWFVFKYWCTGRSEKYEQQKLAYACLSRVVREGGFWAVLVIRYSAIPAHFTTVIFSVCGIKFWVYLLANILSLPKLFITVYVGVAADSNSDSKGSKIISIVVIVVGALITIAAAHWTFRRMDAVRPVIVEERQAARAAKRGGIEGMASAATRSGVDPNGSPTSTPLLLATAPHTYEAPRYPPPPQP